MSRDRAARLKQVIDNLPREVRELGGAGE